MKKPTQRKTKTNNTESNEATDLASKVKAVCEAAPLGARYNAGKPRYDHIPPAFIKALAEHLTAGNMYKYADESCNNRNWEKGMDIADCMRGALSHIVEYNLGHVYDHDPAMPPGYVAHHLIAAVWNLMAAWECERRNIGTDSRPKAQFDDE